MTTPDVAFDWQPLVEPVDRQAARAYAKELRAQGRVKTLGSAIGLIVLGVVLAGGMVLSVAGMLVTALVAGELAAPVGIFGLVIAAGLLALIAFIGVGGTRIRDERWLRMSRFAAANGMTFVPSIPQPHLPGMIFDKGDSREATNLVRGDVPRFVEFGNYRYTTGSGKNRTTQTWGYVAVKLDVPLPHIVLDAVGNNALFGSNLPHIFRNDQRLSLEGDFDQHFSLYCPSGYERDALYLFTPDIMARFIDHAAQLDVEIVDDWLFLYSRRELSTTDPATWGWLFSAVAALLEKFDQWARWRDDRLAGLAPAAQTAAVLPATADAVPPLVDAPQPVAAPQASASVAFVSPPPGVAPPGRRLRGGAPWIAIVIGVVIVGLYVVGALIGVVEAIIPG